MGVRYRRLVLVLTLAALAPPGLASGLAKGERIKGDRALGEYLSGACVTCHQLSGQASGGIPPIVAWPDDQFVAVLDAYRNQERDNAVMRNIVQNLSDEEIAALAAYFGSLPNQPKIQ